MNKKTKNTFLIDIAVPNTHNLAKTISDKQNKYQELANEICAMWKQKAAQVIPIVISSTGVIPKSLSQSVTRLNLHPSTYIRGVAIKKPDSCSNPSLKKKIRQSKCYPLQCSPLADPYTAPCEFSTVGSSAAGRLVLNCSRVASLLLSLNPRTRTWFL